MLSINKILSLVFLCFLFSLSLTAQNLSSEEKKKLKAQFKGYMKNPGSYLREKENNVQQVAVLNKKIETLKSDIERYKEMANQKQEEVNGLNSKLSASEQLLEYERNKKQINNCKGGSYKVQIGKFDKFSLTSYLESGKCIGYENQGGQNTYTIEGFNDANEAFNMAQELRRLGLSGAFVTKFVNNNRTPYDHVAETGAKPYYENAKSSPKRTEVRMSVNPTSEPEPMNTNSSPESRPSDNGGNREVYQESNDVDKSFESIEKPADPAESGESEEEYKEEGNDTPSEETPQF